MSGLDCPLDFVGGTDLKIGHYRCAAGGASPSPTKGIAYKGIAYKGIGYEGIARAVDRGCGRVLSSGIASSGLVRIGSGLQVE